MGLSLVNLVSHVEKNKICSEFLQLAKRDAVEYVLNPNVTAIVVTGSVATQRDRSLIERLLKLEAGIDVVRNELVVTAVDTTSN